VPPGVLHLKSVCSPLDEETVLVAEGTLPPRSFPRARVLPVPAAEARAANVVAFGGGVLCAARAPRTADLLGHAGRRVVVVDTSELVRADGALTCLSLIWDGEDGPDRGVNASRLRAG
jgi:dimethylargininase